MSEKRRGLGRGLGALIPSTAPASGSTTPSRPVDLFIPDTGRRSAEEAQEQVESSWAAGEVPTEKPAVDSGNQGAVEPSTSRSSSSAPEAENEDVRAGGGPDDAGQPRAKAPRSRSKRAQTEDELDLVEVPGAQFAEIPVDDIHPNRKQPRTVFDEEDMAETHAW